MRLWPRCFWIFSKMPGLFFEEKNHVLSGILRPGSEDGLPAE